MSRYTWQYFDRTTDITHYESMIILPATETLKII